MLKIRTDALVEIASANGWLHDKGRLAGTINTRAMAGGLGVAPSTVARAYDSGATGLALVRELHIRSGMSLDELLIEVSETRSSKESNNAAGIAA